MVRFFPGTNFVVYGGSHYQAVLHGITNFHHCYTSSPYSDGVRDEALLLTTSAAAFTDVSQLLAMETFISNPFVIRCFKQYKCTAVAECLFVNHLMCRVSPWRAVAAAVFRECHTVTGWYFKHPSIRGRSSGVIGSLLIPWVSNNKVITFGLSVEQRVGMVIEEYNELNHFLEQVNFVPGLRSESVVLDDCIVYYKVVILPGFSLNRKNGGTVKFDDLSYTIDSMGRRFASDLFAYSPHTGPGPK